MARKSRDARSSAALSTNGSGARLELCSSAVQDGSPLSSSGKSGINIRIVASLAQLCNLEILLGYNARSSLKTSRTSSKPNGGANKASPNQVSMIQQQTSAGVCVDGVGGSETPRRFFPSMAQDGIS